MKRKKLSEKERVEERELMDKLTAKFSELKPSDVKDIAYLMIAINRVLEDSEIKPPTILAALSSLIGRQIKKELRPEGYEKIIFLVLKAIGDELDIECLTVNTNDNVKDMFKDIFDLSEGECGSC